MKPLVAGLLLLLAQAAPAGHGLMNSFGGIEWLPTVDTLPGSVAYGVRRARDAVKARVASTPAEAFPLAMELARHRLAVAEATVRARQPALLREALAHWAAELAAAEQALAGMSGAEQETARHRLANELLEQQYIVATDYLDLPRDARPALQQAFFDAAAARYARLRAALPRSRVEGLFFREEEIRWARQQTLAADEQGL